MNKKRQSKNTFVDIQFTEPRSKNQETYVNYLNDLSKTYVFATGAAGCGKAQPLDSLVKVADGWVKMGDITVGDYVQTPDSSLAKVLGVFYQGSKPIYKITLYDGREVECCEDHLWKWIHNKTEKISSLLELKATFEKSSDKTRFFLPLVDRLEETEKEFFIHPYILGVLISSRFFNFSIENSFIFNKVVSLLDKAYKLEKNNKDTYNIKPINSQTENQYLISFMKMNQYLYGSVEQRLDVLRGVLDNKGCVNKNSGSVSVTLSNTPMLNFIRTLVWSLGGIATISNDTLYISRFPDKKDLFSFPIKKEIAYDGQFDSVRKIRILNIEYVEEKECQCILIDHPEHLYITDNYVITHNTLFAVEKGIEFYKEKIFSKIVITRPAVSVDEDHGFLPGTLQEKMDPWVRPILDIFKEHFSLDHLDYLIQNEKIEISPLAYIRGRTFKYSWIIADEMQNATISQTKSLLTRLGNKSKMVITGDLQQVDTKIAHNGLKDFLDKIPFNSKYIKHIQFSKDDIERHPAIKEILNIYGDE